jgi:hypothetical protein
MTTQITRTMTGKEVKETLRLYANYYQESKIVDFEIASKLRDVKEQLNKANEVMGSLYSTAYATRCPLDVINAEIEKADSALFHIHFQSFTKEAVDKIRNTYSLSITPSRVEQLLNMFIV